MIKGRFGSCFNGGLVLKTDGPYYHVVFVEDDDTKWDMYCEDGEIEPGEDGELRKVVCHAAGVDQHFVVYMIPAEEYIRHTRDLRNRIGK